MDQLCMEENIIIVKWVDNYVVSVGFTCHGVQPVTKVSRYCHMQKRKISIPQPALVSKYKFMGGTDRMNENISYYRTGIRAKKWYWPLFTWMMDAVMHGCS